MPFTFSHPAIILPLGKLPKRWISLTGLVVGSLIPDFEYFIRMKVQSVYSHTIGGLFWFDLPLGIIVAFIFHNIIRNVLITNLPGFFQSRLKQCIDFNWNRYALKNPLAVIISVWIGAASHIFWDAFTHEHGWFVNIIPFLNNTIHLFGKIVPLWKILQHTSSFIGGICILLVIYKIPKSKDTIKKSDLKFWILWIILIKLIFVIRVLSGLHLSNYGEVLITLISASLISLVITCLFLKSENLIL